MSSNKMTRRRRRERRKQRLVMRAEDRGFYRARVIPRSAAAVASCTCGALAFTRGQHDSEFFTDFDAIHAYCDDVVPA